MIGGNFAVWGGLISGFDCAFAGFRDKEDAWNPIAAGAVTGSVLAVRTGWTGMLASGIIGGILIGLIEGVNLGLIRLTADASRPVAPILEQV